LRSAKAGGFPPPAFLCFVGGMSQLVRVGKIFPQKPKINIGQEGLPILLFVF
jgi:hypothetical protein